MKQAIIFGATGFVGSSLVKVLKTNDMPIVAIGRKPFEETSLELESKNYLQFQSENLDFKPIYKLCKSKIVEKDVVFYNVAWGGIDRLTNGTLQDQIKNIFLSSKAIEFAKLLGCSKFINASSQEDAIFQNYIQTQKWKEHPYSSSPLFYASAKHFNKDITTLLAYLNKIDYINTRFSVAITPKLDGASFVSSTLKKIKNQEQYTQPQNPNLCEIVSLQELAEAYYHIGRFGKNKADYYLGMGQPNTLKNYFDFFSKYMENQNIQYDHLHSPQDIAKLFDPSTLNQDTGFAFQKNFPTLAKEILQQ